MRSSDTLIKISPALVKALSAMKGVAKDSKNPHFKNDYASLEAVIESARPVLAEHGLAFMQGLGEYVGGAMTVSTRILHESGEWIESDFQMPVGKADPQGTASASTYARRYSLMGILGLPAVDDDGEAAMTRNQAAPKPSKQEDTHGPDWPNLTNPSSITSNAAKKDEALVKASIDVKSRLDFAPTVRDLESLISDVTPTVAKFPETWRRVLWGEYSATLAELKAAE
jgi:hypothetical protein